MPDRALLIATGNAHKFSEIVSFLEGIPWRVVSLRDFPACDAPEENGDSFEANALIKAKVYGKHLGVAAVADDSGLVVDALNGAPGIYSARYAGVGATDDDNNAKLLAALSPFEFPLRTARFVCCATFVDVDGTTHSATETVEGRIAHRVAGAQGFGYDPLFIPNGYDKSFGELDPSIKANISHRSKAFAALRQFLMQFATR